MPPLRTGSTMTDKTTSQWLREIADALDTLQDRPHGPPVTGGLRDRAGEACVTLCDGDPDRGRTLWKLIAQDCGGYLPVAAARALIWASKTTNLVPDVEAPVPG